MTECFQKEHFQKNFIISPYFHSVQNDRKKMDRESQQEFLRLLGTANFSQEHHCG